jgi:hypothetical protein
LLRRLLQAVVTHDVRGLLQEGGIQETEFGAAAADFFLHAHDMGEIKRQVAIAILVFIELDDLLAG